MTELKKTWFSDRAIAGGDTRRVPIQPEDCYRRPGRMTNDIYALTSTYWGLGCVFYQPGGAQMRCPKLACNVILASRTYFTTGWC